MIKKSLLLFGLICMPLCQARVSPNRVLFIGTMIGISGLFIELNRREDKQEPAIKDNQKQNELFDE